jgi:hypothetical protein
MADLAGFLYSAPLVLLGLVGLISTSELTLLASKWLMFVILVILGYLFDRLRFFVFIDIKGLFVSTEGSLSSVAVITLMVLVQEA